MNNKLQTTATATTTTTKTGTAPEEVQTNKGLFSFFYAVFSIFVGA